MVWRKEHQLPRKELEKLNYQNGFSCRYIINLVMYEIRISGAKAVFITLYTTLFYRKRGERFNVEQVEIIKAGNKN